ncbi:MAG: hypothetical protein ISS16_02375 [Ignavibacteria bacterium]|nr:hypothetical protein [Ignavibacteria bacterium]
MMPKRIKFYFIDYLKVLYSWIRAFRKTFVIEPGLFYTGEEYNIDSPLLVTCNYHMTVFWLWRVLKKRSVRILVIDTNGINVWCSAGKGQFSAGNIISQLKRYDDKIIYNSNKLEIVLPKLSLSGVSIPKLKSYSIKPIIGPVYARDLPEYLDNQPLRDRVNDKFKFSFTDRLFTLVPSVIQFTKYLILMFAALFVWHYFFITGIYWQVLPIGILFGISYIILFPLLPTKKFAIKGLTLFLFFGLMLFYYFINTSQVMDTLTLLFYLSFMSATSIFFSLYYTGNSGVSNYSLVKKEVIHFLPVSAVLYIAAITFIIIIGVMA